MMSSSSTESGCEGPADGNTDNESCDDKSLDQIDAKHPNIGENTILAVNSNQKKYEVDDKTAVPETIAPEKGEEINTQEEKTNYNDMSNILIDNILKEFDSPASIYIPNKSSNKDAEENQNSEDIEKSIIATRRTSGAKASEIIKENSEILERIMRKRMDSMSGASMEIPISLGEEEIDVKSMKNDNQRNSQKVLPSGNLNEREFPQGGSIEPIQSKTSNTVPKKENDKSHKSTKNYPALSAMSPVNPQLSKPQLNPVGGMVVQQRSDVRMGTHNYSKPITFNPFPNSSRIGQRKSNEVGRKLGLYPTNK